MLDCSNAFRAKKILVYEQIGSWYSHTKSHADKDKRKRNRKRFQGYDHRQHHQNKRVLDKLNPGSIDFPLKDFAL